MPDRLERYREMRDFTITPEPRGRRRASKKAKALRYYIQRHAATRLHYDFRLELEGVLKSWAVPKGPSLDPADKRLAMQTEDHPLAYGEFEGVIPEKQYGAGEVVLWDQGVWTPEDPDPMAALRKGRLHLRLDGEKLHGSWILTRTRGNDDRPAWLLIKRNDEEARRDYDITAERPESVKREAKPKRSLARYGKKLEMPAFITPQLATLVTEPPKTGHWLYEVKYDGYRMLARLTKRDARMFTRSGKDWTARLPQLVRGLKALKLDQTWLDGEIVVLRENGRSSFQALQNAFDAGRDAEIVFFVFDAPFLEGEDLRPLPLGERKARLARALKKNSTVRLSEHLEGEAHEVLDKACKLGLEGLIGKLADSPYVSGRTKAWIKLKCRQRQDFVIAGYTAPAGSRTGFGALLLGVHDVPGGKLRYAGKVGTGFDEHLLETITRKLAKLKRPDSPLANPPREKGIQWVRPVLVCEVAYAERTDDGILRQASFMGLREDIPAKSVSEERAQQPPEEPTPARAAGARRPLDRGPAESVVHGIKITHPTRIVYPALDFTKLDLARYYDGVGELIVPQLAGRPLTLVRCPDGVEKECFYQRHLAMGASPGEVKTVRRARSSKGYYIYIDSHSALITLVQNGAVELHTWGARVPDVQHPDRITLDLDPDEGLPWAKLVQATQMTRTIVEALKLRCFLKTTGGKGLHVVVPIAPKLPWAELKEFSHLVAQFMVRAEASLFTATAAKERREGKVFVDYLRNSETASAVSAFSARARRNAGVSTPLGWDELSEKEDVRGRYTVQTVPRRLATLKEDPWADYAATKQSVSAAMWRAVGKK